MNKYFSKFSVLADNKELSIIILVLLVLLMMIIPLPTEVMDMLIAFNIGITVLILMVVIYMKSSLELTAFPSILLVLALLRIGITISTSRLILLNGDAGEIVSTFGEFVVGGNLVVGIIIFIIITIINFIVITKGSERVAEVSARFSLDAMPGKQMSIDSDLRAGNMKVEEAQAKRHLLGLESKLYGAMDGAMKFVKGDAIASIIDILINLVGGLVIGMMQHGMSFGLALEQYSVLTVGDGLVQQVPALLISLTAGMMITQVSDDGAGSNLGEKIIKQIFSNYKALFAASALLIIMAFIPGMPSFVFIGGFIILIVAGIFLKNQLKIKDALSNKATAKDTVVEDTATNKEDNTGEDVWRLDPIVLFLAANLKDSPYIARIKVAVQGIQKDTMRELGVSIPQVVIRYNSAFEDNYYQLQVYEIPVASGQLYLDHILLISNDQNIFSILDMSGSFANKTNFGEKNLGHWIKLSNKAACDEYQLRYMSSEEFMLLSLKNVMRSYLSDFLGIQEVKVLLDKMTEYEDLVRELLRMIPLNKITEILQRLVVEGISIRNFKVILDTMLEWAQREKEPVLIVEYVRKALGKYIAYKFSNGSYTIACVLLDSEVEDAVRDAIRYADEGSYLALDPNISNEIKQQITALLQEQDESLVNVVILTQFDIRRYVRSIIEKDLAYIPVLSFQEVEGHVDFNSIGVIEIN